MLVIGTSMGTPGAANLVKSLAGSVHRRKGAVIHIGKGDPLAASWAAYIDLQVNSDIDVWARKASLRLCKVRAYRRLI